MKLIPLTRGLFAQVDDVEYSSLSKFKWHATSKKSRVCYALRWVPTEFGRILLAMHREVWGPVSSVYLIEHRDGNGLNNQRYNLKRGTEKSNARGFCKKRKSASSQFRGVFWAKVAQKWIAQIRVSGKSFHIGIFSSEIEAAKARDLEARKLLFSEESMNFPKTYAYDLKKT